MIVAAGTVRVPTYARESNTVNLNRLRRRIIAAVATTVVVGVAGTAHADNTPRATALSVGATPATAAATAQAQAPTPNGTLVAAVTVPTAPRSVTAKPGNHQVKLAWLAPSSTGGKPINKYAVQRARPGGPWKTIAYPATRSYTATGLTNGTRYNFRVRAHNAAGWGPFSTTVKSVSRTVPTAPRSLTVTPGNGTVKLAWLAPSSTGGRPINKYAVQRSTSVAGPWKTIASPTTRSYTATGVTNGSKYYFRVRAHNAAGWGPASTVVSAVPRTVPSSPDLQTVTPGNGQVTLAWAAPVSNGGAAIDKYAVQRATGVAGPWTNVGYPTTLDGTATGLTNGTKYLFRILAHNAAGWSPTSAVHAATPRTLPGAPQSLTAQISYTNVGLHWVAPSSDGGSPIDSYRILMKTGVLAPWTTYADTPNTSANINSLQPGVTYQFMVLAHNGVGWGPASSPITVVAGAVSAPTPCTAVKLLQTNTIHVDWTAPDGWAAVTKYRIELYDVTTSPTQHVTTVFTTGDVTDTYLLVPNVGRTYRAEIEAHTAVGTSDVCLAEVYIP
jgi:titin